jgi:hypothetical protein
VRDSKEKVDVTKAYLWHVHTRSGQDLAHVASAAPGRAA